MGNYPADERTDVITSSHLYIIGSASIPIHLLRLL